MRGPFGGLFILESPMHIYRITRHQGDTPVYAGTLVEAKPIATREKQRRTLTDTRIALLDVAVDKDSMVVLLNGNANYPVLRTWKLTDRGGLKELL